MGTLRWHKHAVTNSLLISFSNHWRFLPQFLAWQLPTSPSFWFPHSTYQQLPGLRLSPLHLLMHLFTEVWPHGFLIGSGHYHLYLLFWCLCCPRFACGITLPAAAFFWHRRIILWELPCFRTGYSRLTVQIPCASLRTRHSLKDVCFLLAETGVSKLVSGQ